MFTPRAGLAAEPVDEVDRLSLALLLISQPGLCATLALRAGLRTGEVMDLRVSRWGTPNVSHDLLLSRPSRSLLLLS